MSLTETIPEKIPFLKPDEPPALGEAFGPASAPDFPDLTARPKIIKVPPDWKVTHMPVSGQDVPVYLALVNNPKAVLSIVPGFGASPASYHQTIQMLNEAQISVVAMEWPKIGKNTEFNDLYAESVRQFLFHHKSPIHDPAIARPEVPRLNLTHSSGGLYFYYQCLDRQNRQYIERSSEGVTHAAPFLDISNASANFHWFGRMAYSTYARFVQGYVAGQSPVDKFYLRFTSGNESALLSEEDADSLPTHAQIRELLKTADTILKKVKDGTIPHLNLPQIFVVSERDPCACILTAEWAGAAMGARIIRVPAEHNPIVESSETQKFLEAFALRDVQKMESILTACARHHPQPQPS